MENVVMVVSGVESVEELLVAQFMELAGVDELSVVEIS